MKVVEIKGKEAYHSEDGGNQLAPREREREIYNHGTTNATRRVSHEKQRKEGRVTYPPIRRLAHALHDAVERLLPALLECGQGALTALLVGRELEQAVRECARVTWRCFSDLCSRTVSLKMTEERIVLDAVGAPLALRNLA
jgi:hypothetical protein